MGGRWGTPAERFWPKVQVTDDCWLWTAATRRGYGHFYRSPGKWVAAHRFSYESLRGEIPEGLTLDHLCRVPACVNPGHLEPVTLEENLRRAAPYSYLGTRTECANGHEYNDENTRRGDHGQRVCRPCQRDRARAYKARQRAELAAAGLTCRGTQPKKSDYRRKANAERA